MNCWHAQYMAETVHVPHVSCIINLHSYEWQNLFLQPAGGSTHIPDGNTDETTALTSQVITSFLSKLTESSSSDSSSRLLSAIEQAPSLE